MRINILDIVQFKKNFFLSVTLRIWVGKPKLVFRAELTHLAYIDIKQNECIEYH